MIEYMDVFDGEGKLVTREPYEVPDEVVRLRIDAEMGQRAGLRLCSGSLDLDDLRRLLIALAKQIGFIDLGAEVLEAER